MKSSPLLCGFSLLTCLGSLLADGGVLIGDRLELFLDDHLIASMEGDARQVAHRPEARDVALVTGEPWEGNTSAYYTVFQDGDLFRLYYRGSHSDEKTQKSQHPEVTCYAESHDGILWTKPRLGLVEWEGSKANNIIWAGPGTHNFAPFRDGNPLSPADARYKALGSGKGGLVAFQSPDGIRWSLMRKDPVITKGAFDSQNLAFWDPVRMEYCAYWRIFTNGVRAIRTSTTMDFMNWPNYVDLVYPNSPPQHLYTNAVGPYFRAPHLFVAFPTRYLPDEGERVEPIFMTSRDGVSFHRWNEPVIPQGAPKDRAGNRSNYMARGMAVLQGFPDEITVYATEAYYAGPDSRLRRFVFRLDGFVSVRGGAGGGILTTKALNFTGRYLRVNYTTSDGGSLEVELLDADGRVIPEFSSSDCEPLTGDSVNQIVRWKQGNDLSALKGKAVRVRFSLKNAALYSMRFK